PERRGSHPPPLELDGSAADLDDLASRAAAALHPALGSAPIAPERAAALRAALPASSEAARAYAAGIARYARFDTKGSLAAYQRAIDAEDSFALAHLEFSRVLSDLGSDARALEEAKRAFDLSATLGREQRLVIEAQRAVAAKDWSTAS